MDNVMSKGEKGCDSHGYRRSRFDPTASHDTPENQGNAHEVGKGLRTIPRMPQTKEAAAAGNGEAARQSFSVEKKGPKGQTPLAIREVSVLSEDFDHSFASM
jgi:hypothetical protein